MYNSNDLLYKFAKIYYSVIDGGSRHRNKKNVNIINVDSVVSYR